MREATLLVQRCLRRLQEEDATAAASSTSSASSQEKAASDSSSMPQSAASSAEPPLAISNRRVGHASSRAEAVLEIKLDRPTASVSAGAGAAAGAGASASSILVWSGAQQQFHAPLAAQLEEDIYQQLKAHIKQ